MVTSPNPAGSGDTGQLYAVTCVSSDDCWAVGFYNGSNGTGVSETLVEQYNGMAWNIVASPNPAGSTDTELTGVACVVSAYCWAVGDFESGGNWYALVEEGTSAGWSLDYNPDVPGSNSAGLLAVTCDAFQVAADCWAVGDAYVGGTKETLIEQNTGGGWSIVSSPDPAGNAGAALSGVACGDTLAGMYCAAVGNAMVGGVSQTLIEEDSGSGWTIQTSSNLAGLGAYLTSVACAESFCLTLGFYYNSDGYAQTLAEMTLSGSQTFATFTPLGSAVSGWFLAAACRGDGACWGVGDDSDDSGDYETLIEEDLGGSPWSVVHTLNAPQSDSWLNNVTCMIDPTDCWAVGASTEAAPLSETQTLLEQDQGGGWSIVESPNPAGSVYAELEGVNCLDEDDCWAVGYYETAGGTPQTLTEQYTAANGWQVVASPDPTGSTHSELDGVACIDTDDCWAAGYDSVGGGEYQTLLEEFNGANWSIVTGPSNPPGATGGQLGGVTCVAVTTCFAVGESQTGTSTFQTLTEENTGSGWSIVSSPDFAGTTDSWLNGVTCTSTTDCWAVGSGNNSGGHYQSLVEQYGNSGWSIADSANPNSGTDPSLVSVTCADDADCWAVGWSVHGANIDDTLVEADTGDGWSIVSSPDPTNSWLGGVACLGADDCEAVGQSGKATLIEQSSETQATGYTPLVPFRVCDTRYETDTECSGGPAGTGIGQGGTLTFQVTGVTGPGGQSVPATAQSVVLNVTAILGNSFTYLTAYPAGSARPDASNLNVPAGGVQANLVVVALGQGGQVSLYNSLGIVNVAVDVEGYFSAPTMSPTPGLFHSIPPLRICDTREGMGTACSSATADQALGQGQWRKVVVSGLPPGAAEGTPSVPADGTATAVALNLTAVLPSSFTYLSVEPPSAGDACPTGDPSFSNLNLSGGGVLPNRVIVPLGPDQDVCVYNSLGSVDFILDVNGWFGTGAETSQGAYFYAISPTRICDTRQDMGTECSGNSIGPGEALTVQVAGVDGIPETGGSSPPVAVIANVTAVLGSQFTYLTLYPSDVARPIASDLNIGAGQVTPNLSIVQLAPAGDLDLFNDEGTINAIVDIAGWFQ